MNGLVSYEDFKATARNALIKGEIEITYKGKRLDDLSELEWAMQYVICHYWEEGKREFTIDELYAGISKYCGDDVLGKCFPKEATA